MDTGYYVSNEGRRMDAGAIRGGAADALPGLASRRKRMGAYSVGNLTVAAAMSYLLGDCSAQATAW